MIRVTCAGCGSKLNAKDELAGKTRKCPKCGGTIEIPRPAESPDTVAMALDESAVQHVEAASEDALPTKHFPERLVRLNRYLILDKAKVFAAWENNGSGWMLKTSFGFVQASRNHEQLPAEGNFTLVEMQMRLNDDGLRLEGLICYQLARRWALTNLDKADDRILKSIASLGSLNKVQKAAVQKALRELFMRQVWEDASNVLDFLVNGDFHSPGTVPIGETPTEQ